MRHIFYQILTGLTLLGLTAFEMKETIAPTQPAGEQHHTLTETRQLTVTGISQTIHHSGKMMINGKTYEDPVIYAFYDGEIQIEMWQQPHQSTSAQPANLIVSFTPFTGPGTYILTEENYPTFSISGSEEAKDVAYTIAYKDSNRKTHYGPASITITQCEGIGKPLVGMINGTLYQNGQHDKPIQVSGSFEVVVQG